MVAKHHRLPQPSGPQRLPLPAGGHGGPPVHAAAGEGGANGRHRGAQRPARGAARRGWSDSLLRLKSPRSLSVLCLTILLESSALPHRTLLLA